MKTMILENAQEGDLVVNEMGATSRTTYLAQITKATKRFLFVDGAKFRRDGSQVNSDPWHRQSIRPATKEDIDRFNLEQEQTSIKRDIHDALGTTLDKVSLEDLKTILAILEKVGKDADRA